MQSMTLLDVCRVRIKAKYGCQDCGVWGFHSLGLLTLSFREAGKAFEFEMDAAEVVSFPVNVVSSRQVWKGGLHKQLVQLITQRSKVSPLNASSSNDCRLWLQEPWQAIHWKVTLPVTVLQTLQPFHTELCFGFEF